MATEAARWSLRHRLVGLLLAATTALWLLSALTIYWDAERESQELFDQTLQETARLLLVLSEHELEERAAGPTDPAFDSGTDPEPHYRSFQIWNDRGHLLYRSSTAPLTPLQPAASEGFGWARAQGTLARTYVAWSPARRLQIQIAEPMPHRSEIGRQMAGRLALFALTFLPLLGGLVWWLTRRALNPILTTAQAVAARSPDELAAVESADAPNELAPLIAALNRLLQRTRDTLARERRFTADASHELRTPLAAIRTNVQVMLRARNPAEAAEAGQDLLASVDRSARLIDQLLGLARIDASPEGNQVRFAPIDMGRLLAAQAAAHAGAAQRKHLALSVDAATAPICGAEEELTILLRNLIDNAIRYTPAGGRVVLSCRTLDGGGQLTVADSGVGISKEARARIFERFYRVPGSAAPGSGLGLSIAQRIVELHGARIEVGEGLDGRGTRFVITFPRAPGGTAGAAGSSAAAT